MWQIKELFHISEQGEPCWTRNDGDKSSESRITEILEEEEYHHKKQDLMDSLHFELILQKYNQLILWKVCNIATKPDSI